MIITRLGRAVVLVEVLVAALACMPIPRTAADLDSDVLYQEPRKSRSDLIVRSDLVAVDGSTALDAVRTLRPEYLRPSTYRTMEAQRTYATVYIDDRFVGGLDALTLVPIGEIIEVQYLKAVAAG